MYCQTVMRPLALLKRAIYLILVGCQTVASKMKRNINRRLLELSISKVVNTVFDKYTLTVGESNLTLSDHSVVKRPSCMLAGLETTDS